MKSRRFGNASNPTLLLSALLLALCLPSLRVVAQPVEQMTDEQIISELLSNLEERENLLRQNAESLRLREQRLTTLEESLQQAGQTLSEISDSLSDRQNSLTEIERSLKSYDAAVRRELLTWKLITATLAVLTVVMAIK